MPPLGNGLARSGVDQIKRDTLKNRIRIVEGGKRVRRAVVAVKEAERGVVQRLHTDRQAIDAGGAKIAQPPAFRRRRIGLQRDFHIIR